MNRAIALKWARALESGEYRQATGQLRSVNGFCCLGVLCNLHAQAHPEIAAREHKLDWYLGENTELPEAVMIWADMMDIGASFVDDFRIEYTNFENVICEADGLIDLNDNAKFDFKQIAAIIRKHSEKL